MRLLKKMGGGKHPSWALSAARKAKDDELVKKATLRLVELQ